MEIYEIGKLDAPDPVQIGGGAWHTSLAVVIGRKDDKKRNEKLLRAIFFLNSKEFSEDVEELVSSTELVIDAPGRYVVGVELEVQTLDGKGNPLFDSSGKPKIERVGRITKKITAGGVPKKLGVPAITFAGKQGRYRLNVFVPNEDGQPLAGEPVNITLSVPRRRNNPREFFTNAFGRVDKYIPIAVVNTEATVRVRSFEESYRHLEALPPAPMNRSHWIGISVGAILLVVAALGGMILSSFAP